MQSIHSPPRSNQKALSNAEQPTSAGMSKVAMLNEPAPSFFQSLPNNEADRKHLLVRALRHHNLSCSDPANKIHVQQVPFSVTNHKLAKWIDTTFSDLSADGMYLITFALGCFATYHDLVRPEPMVPSTANKLVIEDWFQRYGTEGCSKVLTDLSHLIKAIKTWDYFTRDLQKFCSRVNPESIKKAEFEAISGSSVLNRDIINCYYASSAIFSQITFLDDIEHRAFSAFNLTLNDVYRFRKSYQKNSFRVIMACLDIFIRSRKVPDSSLVQEMLKRFQQWSSNNRSQHMVIESFQQALEIIERMQTDEAVRASLQSQEHTDSSLMTTPPPALPATDEEEDTFDLC